MPGSAKPTTDHDGIRKWIEERGLAFLYQEEMDGEKSRFFKFVAREG